jgi:DNA-binding NtrC family response regulator
MSSFPVLIVEDKDSLRTMLRHALEGHGHAVLEARDETEAIEQLRQTRPVVVLTDLKLPVGDGFGVLRAAKELDPDLQVVVMTAYGSIQDAVTAMKDGAMDFLAKPIDPDHLLLMVGRAIAQRRMLTEYFILKEELAERRGAPRIIGEDAKLRQVSQQLHRAAATDATVLLEGESGTGKELFARRCTRSARVRTVRSWRSTAPRFRRRCSRRSSSGTRRARSPARAAQAGRFEIAHRGTLFLDEIGDLPLPLQAKILRVLEEKQFERVGGTQSLHVDVRIVAATNRHLKQRVGERLFREDLYFRLSVFPITIPPLRERGDDVLMLARHFVDKFCRDLNKNVLAISTAAIDEMRAYQWPGNVRELQNCIERAVILTEDDAIQPRHLNLTFRQTAAAQAVVSPWDHIDLSGTLSDAVSRVTAEAERRKIGKALQDAGGNKAFAADALHIGYKALLQKLKTHGLADS